MSLVGVLAILAIGAALALVVNYALKEKGSGSGSGGGSPEIPDEDEKKDQ